MCLRASWEGGRRSRVFRAYDRATKTAVAIKVVTERDAGGWGWQERLGRELRLARQGRHRHVCDVYDLMEADGHRFLTMALATRGTLRESLAGTPERTWEERLADAQGIVSGLAALHADGIVHRDLKPESVLRMGDGRLVVSDFGLAVVPGQSTFTSDRRGAVGTPLYMAPEVALGGEATMASDVFALGVILHELFFDCRPAWLTTKRGRFVKPPAVKGASRILRSMARLCLDCLEQLAPRRPQTAGEVKRRFERAVLGRYGTIKGALKAGRWGIVAGMVLVVGVTTVSIVATRTSKGGRLATIEGTPQDWSRKARLVVRRSGGIHCAYPSQDGKSVRLIWGDPREAVQVDVASSQVTPWDLHVSAYQHYCPEISPDGQRLAYDTRSSEIMVSADARGNSVKRLTFGYLPRWLPGGREIVYAFDARRLAMTDLTGVTSLLPEYAGADEVILDIQVDVSTGRLVALYKQAQHARSALVVASIPSGRLISRIDVPGVSTRAAFSRRVGFAGPQRKATRYRRPGSERGDRPSRRSARHGPPTRCQEMEERSVHHNRSSDRVAVNQRSWGRRAGDCHLPMGWPAVICRGWRRGIRI